MNLFTGGGTVSFSRMTLLHIFRLFILICRYLISFLKSTIWWCYLVRRLMLLVCECVCVCYDINLCVNVWVILASELYYLLMQFQSRYTPSVPVAVHRSNSLCRIAGRKLHILFLQSSFLCFICILK